MNAAAPFRVRPLGVDLPTLMSMLELPASDRYDVLLEAFRRGATIERCCLN